MDSDKFDEEDWLSSMKKQLKDKVKLKEEIYNFDFNFHSAKTGKFLWNEIEKAVPKASVS